MGHRARGLPLVEPFYNRPCAAPGLTSYRYRTTYGWIMIGATSHADALREAQRSTDSPIEFERLEVWNGEHYTPARP